MFNHLIFFVRIDARRCAESASVIPYTRHTWEAESRLGCKEGSRNLIKTHKHGTIK